MDQHNRYFHFLNITSSHDILWALLFGIQRVTLPLPDPSLLRVRSASCLDDASTMTCPFLRSLHPAGPRLASAPGLAYPSRLGGLLRHRIQRPVLKSPTPPRMESSRALGLLIPKQSVPSPDLGHVTWDSGRGTSGVGRGP